MSNPNLLSNPTASGYDMRAPARQLIGFPGGIIFPAAIAADSSLATANANTAAINAALATGRDVYIRAPGTYTLACTTPKVSGTKTYNVALIIPSNTRFTIGAGVVLQVRAGTTNPVLIQNSDITGGNSNITIDGLGDFNGNSANVTRDDGTIFSCIMMWFQKVTGLYLNDFRAINAQAWAIGIADCTTVRTRGVRFYYTDPQTANQGGFQCQGPNNDHVIENTSGYTIDDAVAYVCHDYGVYASAMAGPGAANNITIRGVHADKTLGMWHHVRLLDSTTNILSNVHVSNLTGPYNKGGPMVGGSSTGAASFLRNITFDGVMIYPTSATPQEAMFTLNGSIESINLTNIQRNVPITETAKPLVQIDNTFAVPTIGRIRVSNVDWVDDSSSSNLITLERSNGGINAPTVTDMEVSNITGKWSHASAGGAIVANNAASAVIGSVLINQVRMLGGGRVLYNGGSITTRAKLNNISCTNRIRALVRHNNTTGTLPKLDLSNVDSGGTGIASDGGELTFSTAVSGGIVVTANNVDLANGAVTVSNPATVAAVAWDGATLQGVETGVITNVLGYMVRDRSDGQLKRCSTAPSTYTAL